MNCNDASHYPEYSPWREENAMHLSAKYQSFRLFDKWYSDMCLFSGAQCGLGYHVVHCEMARS